MLSIFESRVEYHEMVAERSMTVNIARGPDFFSDKPDRDVLAIEFVSFILEMVHRKSSYLIDFKWLVEFQGKLRSTKFDWRAWV